MNLIINLTQKDTVWGTQFQASNRSTVIGATWTSLHSPLTEWSEGHTDPHEVEPIKGMVISRKLLPCSLERILVQKRLDAEKAQKSPNIYEKQPQQNLQKVHSRLKRVAPTIATLFCNWMLCTSWACACCRYRTLANINTSFSQSNHGIMEHHPTTGTVTD